MTNLKEKSLADSALIGEAMCTSARDAIYVINNAGIVRAGNIRLWTDLGLSESQSGQISLLGSVVESERAIALRGWQTVISTRMSERCLRKFKNAKGELKVYSVVESPIVVDNQVSTILGVARDVTEDSAIEEKLWGAQEQAHAEQEYAIRASMGLIKGYIYTLERIDSLPAGSRERFGKIIVEEIETMGRNIENIFMRRGSTQRNSQDMVFDLSEVVAESINTYKAESDRRQIPIILEKPDHEVTFFGQPLTVSRVIGSLISCALIRITHTGTIHLRICDCEEYVEILVSDSGESVTQGQVDELMCASNESKKQMNLPIGSKFDFDIARLLVDAMGGGIIPRVGSEEGLEFTIMLPRSLYTEMQNESRVAASPHSLIDQ